MADLSWKSSPEWLVELQASVGRTLRAPLDRSSGVLKSEMRDYDSALLAETLPGGGLSAAERLAVYHRQYWFRLFTLLQRAYPLVTRLVGFWELNRFATRYVVEQPPSGWDIDSVASAFAPFLQRTWSGEEIALTAPDRRLPGRALCEATAIDAAYQRVFRSPAEASFQPSSGDAARLLDSRLRLSRAAARISESWRLCELRARVISLEGEATLPLPEAWPEPHAWLLIRQQLSLRMVPLEPLEARLLALLETQPVGAALAELEAACPEQERASLPERTRHWLARSVQLGVWSGLE